MSKQITAAQAALLVEDGMTLAVSGFGAHSPCDELLKALEERYAATRHPKDLTVIGGICGGNNLEDDISFNRLKAPGLIDTLIAGHVGNAPCIAKAIMNNEMAAYLFPLGVVMHLYRAAAGKKPGILSTVGLGTFVDPRIEGAKANARTREQNKDMVELLTLDGKEMLYYKTVFPDCCFIRGTYADQDGNISIVHEAYTDAQLEIAEAVHNHGGIVIVQVEDIVQETFHPREVRIHRTLVDYIVKASPENHVQSYGFTGYRPELTGQSRISPEQIPPMEMDIRKIIARRAAMELVPDQIVNLGIGIPSGVASVANEEGIADQLTTSLESGPLGGVPVEGIAFGVSVNPEVIYSVCDIFDQYDGGVLDMAFLGAAQIDAAGNVNVSKFADRCTGPGGFINITQNAGSVFFLGTFSTGGLRTKVENGCLVIQQEGKYCKFVSTVDQITFSAEYANFVNQKVMYITERAVFVLQPEGIMLTEIAPGVDLEKDILAQMEFRPLIAENIKYMDERIFRLEKMNLQIRQKTED